MLNMSKAQELLQTLSKYIEEDVGGLSAGLGSGIGGMGVNGIAGVANGIGIDNLGRGLATGVGGGLISAKYPDDGEDKEQKKTLKKLKKKGIISSKDMLKALQRKQNLVQGKRVYFY
jgi:hypothetical protein